MSATLRIRVSADLALEALGMAYVKGDITDAYDRVRHTDTPLPERVAASPLPALNGKETRKLIEQILRTYPVEEIGHWRYKLRVYPTKTDPRTHGQVVDQVEAWAKARISRLMSAYKYRDEWRLWEMRVDPANFIDE